MGFMEQMNVFSMHVMQALALSLGLGHDFFDSTFLHSPHYQMKEKIRAFLVSPQASGGTLTAWRFRQPGWCGATGTEERWWSVPLLVKGGQHQSHGYDLKQILHRKGRTAGTLEDARGGGGLRVYVELHLMMCRIRF